MKKVKRKRSVPSVITDEIRTEILRLADEGASAREIAERLRVNWSAVKRVASGRLHAPGGRKSNLSEEVRSEIARLYKEGTPMKRISQRLGVSITAVLDWTVRLGLREYGTYKGRVQMDGKSVLPALRPMKRYLFIRDDGTPDEEAQRNYDELWDMKDKAYRSNNDGFNGEREKD